MDGKITDFDDEAQQGSIVTREGQCYTFSLADWRGRGLPGPDILVRFDVRDSHAVQVFNLPEKQRRATAHLLASDHAHAASDAELAGEYEEGVGRRYSSWALAAIVVAILGLFFDILAPVLGLVAAILAILGLRHIRRQPQRYRGRGFCWAAIILSLIVATLSLLLEPLPATSLSQLLAVPGHEQTG
ncbi:DUF4190 domain-containing protein [Halomonas sp. McH1-25]|uniref:DUF4190 domain-containing protein n=1 Tax=unclassified Halomonas TaxID=2609666 RepID=UPI001EF60A8D|nr:MULTISPECIES: DUF4190 domain-containing protein [unclassified Halomonas]MCG7599127.1 DUF4190 domain-containing protein [Halomonas sp. McH1-25]MCP1343595.1 DUF4190 domain-containing protein [Halomonas sp. FL8]MCP1361077.1 DUF4190 domain-containing protein [Halomonas sp. BBD45]MCP1366238.1 DUF4190 domain-containing protein [Halomonas sp. BBD48]